MQTHYIRQPFLWTMYNEIQSSRSVKCSNWFPFFFYFNNTLMFYTRIKKEKLCLHITIISGYSEKYTKKFHHNGVFMCTNYFSSVLFQQHTEVLQYNK